MIRFLTNAFPLLLLMLALFGFAVEVMDLEPRSGAVVRLTVFEPSPIPPGLVLGAWIMEACGLLALFLLAQGRCGSWWLDGLVAGWVAWIFRGPLLVLTIVVAARQPQDPWWDLALAWWVLYSLCGLALALLARRSGIVFASPEGEAETALTTEPAAESSGEIPESAVSAEPADETEAVEQDAERQGEVAEPSVAPDEQAAPEERAEETGEADDREDDEAETEKPPRSAGD